MSKPAILIIGISERDADLFYATKFLAPDPIVFTKIRGKTYTLVSDLEIDRAKKEARVDKVFSISRLATDYKKKHRKKFSLIGLVLYFLKKQRVKSIFVPGNFPIQYYEPLKRAGFRIRYKEVPFFDERGIKNHREITAIKKTLRATECAVAQAIRVLKRSVIKKKKLFFKGKILTCDFLKKVIHQSLLEQGCLGDHPIVSCGAQTVDPHHSGSGPLYAHQPIVMDIFPRDRRTLYHADFTRTVVRGKASPKLKKIYATVKKGQEIAFKMIRAGVGGKKIHAAIQKEFTQLGFNTGVMKGRMQGFFHSTGHGLGLEIHEPPRIGPGDDVLKAGQVVTVEPGLYYKDVGGVRLEDVVVITKKGCVNLTRFPKKLEI